MNIQTKIFNANKDILERLDVEKITGKYLKKEDVFLVNFGEITEDLSDSIDVLEGLIIIHYNSDTYKITGFTVPYVKEFLEFVDKLKHDKEPAKNIQPSQIAASSLAGLSFAY